jgi:hypothetical protein
MAKVQGSSALRLGFSILARKAFCRAARVQKLAFRSKRLARLNLTRCARAHANQGKHEFIRVILTGSFNPG